MIVEFMGLPGSGKTRLHRTARKVIEKGGYSVWDPDEIWDSIRRHKEKSDAKALTRTLKLATKVVLDLVPQLPQLFRFCTRHFRFVFGIFWMALRNPNTIRTRLLLVKYLLIDICQYADISDHNGEEEIVLVDEGFIQHIFTNLVQSSHNTDFQKVRWYIKNAPLPDLLIYVPTTPETCLQRMRKRGLPRRLQHEPIDTVRTLLSRGDEVFAFVFGIIERISHGMTKAHALGKQPSQEIRRIFLVHIAALAKG